MTRLIFAIVALLSATTLAWADTRVIDGDTIDVNGTSYRIYGIDAPEAGQTCISSSGGTWPCGNEAIDAMTALIEGKDIQCDDIALDDYGRMLAVCYTDGTDIGEAMITRGMAWAFRRYGNAYDEVEDQIRPTGIGIWQAETEAPWDYRAKRWNVGEQEAPDGCPIKGNINRQGERIYHAPWSPWYSRTKVSIEQGERWFCDEGEALEAGWRAPYWGG